MLSSLPVNTRNKVTAYFALTYMYYSKVNVETLTVP